MSDVKCAGMLLKAAERDIDALRVLIRSDGISDEIMGFHVQQATEKLLEAWIALEGVEYPMTHNIEGLLELLAGRSHEVSEFRDLASYTPYAVDFRDAGSEGAAEPMHRRDAVALVVNLHGRVFSFLEQVVQR